MGADVFPSRAKGNQRGSKLPMNATCMTQPGTDMIVSASTAAKMGHPGKRSN